MADRFLKPCLLIVKTKMQTLLFRILGRRVALLFGGICFLSVSVLGSLYMTAGYSLAEYVSNQMDQLPWDVSTLQQRVPVSHEQLRNDYQGLVSVQKSEAMGVVRLQRGSGVVGIDIDGEPLPLRWIVLIATTEPSIMPPALQTVESRTTAPPSGISDDDHESELYARAALLTASSTTAGTAKIRADSKIRIYALDEPQQAGHHHGTSDSHHHFRSDLDHVSHIAETLFSATIIESPSQVKRLEINKWMLANLGSLSFLPENSLVLSIPMSTYEQVVKKLNKLFVNFDDNHGGFSAPPYLPELTHLIDLENDYFLSSWSLGSSIQNLSSQLRTISSLASDITASSYVSSDAYRVLTRMANISRLVGLVILLIAIPLLWLIWVVSNSLSSLFLMNERRLIGLILLRGISLKAIGSSLRRGLIIGCLAGGVLGLLAGLGVPVLAYKLVGHSPPPWSVFTQGLFYFLLFIGIGIVLSLVAGQRIIKRIRQMTPRVAMARVTGDDAIGERERPSVTYVLGAFVALLLGSYKVCAWTAGHSLVFPVLRGAVSESSLQIVMLAESLLNFIAVPLFLFGVIGILRWRPIGFRKVMELVSVPLVGRLHWFVAEHMRLGWYRVTSTIFLTSLAMSLALLPQVAADTFYDRVLRGVDTALGGDIQIIYDLTELAKGKGDPATVAVYDELVRDQLLSIKDQLEGRPDVASVAELQEYVIPGFYLPSQSALILNLLRDTDRYLNTVRYEEHLGLTKPFSDVVGALNGDYLGSSRGFLKVREVPLESDVIFGNSNDFTPLIAQLKDVVAFLPGQPSISVSQREGYATAEAHYLNYVMGSDARVFSVIDRFTQSSLSALNVIPSQAVILLKMKGEIGAETIKNLANSLPTKPQAIRWQGEERMHVNEDMFISLALGNMKVFMIGGLILAVAGVFAVSLASFRAEKRTLSLLRLRGIPLPMLLRISLSMFLIPVIVGAALGVLLGTISGYGISQAIWELPRIYGMAGALENQFSFSQTAWSIVAVFGAVLTCVGVGFGLWPLRRTAHEAIKD